jgi:hypothetical protein
MAPAPTAPRFDLLHHTVGQWEAEEPIRQQDGQEIGFRKVMRDNPNHQYTMTAEELAAYLADLHLEHGESLRISRDDTLPEPEAPPAA